MRLDPLLRDNIHSTIELDIVEDVGDKAGVDNQIIIFDCRRHFPDLNKGELPQPGKAHSSIALIEPEPDNRRNAFRIGFADFLCWPVLAPELYTRVLAQCRALSLKEPSHRYSRVALVERCCTYMAGNITQSVSIRTLAQKFNTNHNTLTNLFKQEMGLPPLAWQRKMRLESAAHQLQSTNTPISIIAADVGYELPGNFATAFRKYFGINPNEYRKREQRKD